MLLGEMRTECKRLASQLKLIMGVVYGDFTFFESAFSTLMVLEYTALYTKVTPSLFKSVKLHHQQQRLDLWRREKS